MFKAGFFLDTFTGLLISAAISVGVLYWVLPPLLMGSAALKVVVDAIRSAGIAG